jgi:hypothetical protein
LTKPLGEKLRHFAGKVTKDFVVKEHPKETAAKTRRAAANLKQKTTKGKGPAKEVTVKKSTKGKQKESTKGKQKESTKGKQKKSTKGKQPEKKTISMSLLTYKFHALGDYAQTIRECGTTDSYNSQTVNILLYSETYLIGFSGRV